MVQTIDQRRAKHAWEAIEKIKNANGKDDYAREAKKLPVRIMTAGLGQALAFLHAKKKNKHALENLVSDITTWIGGQNNAAIRLSDPSNLIKSIISGDTELLSRVTSETLAYMQWLNRFAEGAGLKAESQDND